MLQGKVLGHSSICDGLTVPWVDPPPPDRAIAGRAFRPIDPAGSVAPCLPGASNFIVAPMTPPPGWSRARANQREYRRTGTDDTESYKRKTENLMVCLSKDGIYELRFNIFTLFSLTPEA